MQIKTSTSSEHAAVSAPTRPMPKGALGLKIRSAERILSELLLVPRDSPTMRIKIAEAREELTELWAQVAPGVATPPALVVVTEPKLAVSTHPVTSAATPPPLPPRLKAPRAPTYARERISPVQQMRYNVSLDAIDE